MPHVTATQIIAHQDKRITALARAGVGYPGDEDHITDTCYVNNAVAHLDFDYICADLLEICEIEHYGIEGKSETWVEYLAVMSGPFDEKRWAWLGQPRRFFDTDPGVWGTIPMFYEWVKEQLAKPRGR